MANFLSLFKNSYEKFWLELIFPKRCFGCQSFGRYLCPSCFSNTPKTTKQRCIICQKPSLSGFTHPKCQNKYSPDRLITFFPYTEHLIANLIKVGKYQFIPAIFSEIAELSIPLLSRELTNKEKYQISCIPLHKKKLKWRGFNHAEVLVKSFANNLEIPVDANLHRKLFTKPQKDLNALERKSNLKNVFDYEAVIPTKKESIILVDDIITTGSTFIQASKALKKGGYKEVLCIAIAQD